ncbi:MAG: ABC transporter permease [Solirubrobacterales bacterium]|nr:ABC transporter permease [Solirubrobacterales bacterium]
MKSGSAFDKPRFLRVFTGLVYVFLFVPILVVIVFSFNSQKSLQVMDGISLRWYEDFFNDSTLRESLFISIEIALITMVVATVVGTALAIGLVRSRSRMAKGSNLLMLVPLVTPEIVAGISALLIFSQLGIGLSFWTIVLAHITFSISYVTIVVRGRLATIGIEIEDAARDLGASRLESVRLVLVPALWPAVVAAGLLVFALSFDDFVLSFFTTGEQSQPLPVRIWSMIRFGVSPTINAIGTLMMVVSISAVALAVMIPRFFGRRESGVKVLTGAEG